MEEPIPMEVLDDTDADFLAAEATIVNAVSPHVTITDRGGTPKVQRVTVTDIDGSRYFDVSDGAKGDTGDAAGFGTINISMDPNNPGPGTPAVDYSASGPDTAKNLSLIFKNLKGVQGDKGDTGDTGPQGIQGIQGPKGDRGDPGTTIFEYAGVANFPNPGISGMAYVDTTTNTMYRWTGSGYESISNAVSYASQSEAEAGVDNTKAMTPLRTRQALEAYAMTMQEVDTAVNQGLADNLGGV